MHAGPGWRVPRQAAGGPRSWSHGNCLEGTEKTVVGRRIRYRKGLFGPPCSSPTAAGQKHPRWAAALEPWKLLGRHWENCGWNASSRGEPRTWNHWPLSDAPRQQKKKEFGAVTQLYINTIISHLWPLFFSLLKKCDALANR